MNNSAVIMMLVAIVIIWGGLIASLVRLLKAKRDD